MLITSLQIRTAYNFTSRVFFL